MRPSPLTQFRTLAGEAVLDAVRRRIVAAIAVVSLLSLMLVDTCTTCGGGEVIVNGEVREMANIAGWTGTVTFAVLGLWSIVLAGVLASEHLAQTLADGSATLALARPVGRGTFAFARLAGSLAIALVTGAVLLGGTTLFLHARSGLPTGPALVAGCLLRRGRRHPRCPGDDRLALPSAHRDRAAGLRRDRRHRAGEPARHVPRHQ
jgi:hypothetical protein